MKYAFFISPIVSFALTTFAQDLGNTFQITPYTGVHGYTWTEFDANGQQALKESGPRFSFGVLSRISFMQEKQLFVDLDLRYNTGTVDYDGFLMDQMGNRTPYSTKTAYSDFELTATGGYSFKIGREFRLAPVAGFGFEYWNRDLDNGGPQGYDEKYTVFFANVGVEGTLVPSRSFSLFSALFIRIPLTIAESINLAARGQGGPPDINLSPGINPRFVVQTGGNAFGVYVLLFFETWTLSTSAADKGFHQPESKRTHFGIQLGYTIGVN